MYKEYGRQTAIRAARRTFSCSRHPPVLFNHQGDEMKHIRDEQSNDSYWPGLPGAGAPEQGNGNVQQGGNGGAQPATQTGMPTINVRQDEGQGLLNQGMPAALWQAANAPLFPMPAQLAPAFGIPAPWPGQFAQPLPDVPAYPGLDAFAPGAEAAPLSDWNGSGGNGPLPPWQAQPFPLNLPMPMQPGAMPWLQPSGMPGLPPLAPRNLALA
jgi:hypothetical protein